MQLASVARRQVLACPFSAAAAAAACDSFPPSLLVTGHLYGADGTWCRRLRAKPCRSASQQRLLQFFLARSPTTRPTCTRTSSLRAGVLAQVFTFEGEEGLAVSRCGSGATGGKILKLILAISTIFFLRRKCVTGALRYLVFSSALANLRRRMLFRLSLSLSFVVYF